MKEHINYILVGERHIMRIKRKIHRYRIRKTIIFNGILNKSRCTAMKDKTSLWHTFFNSAKIGVCQVKCVSLYFFLTGSFQSCRFCMPGSILFILQNACLHFVIHGKLVADECPVGYRAAIPFLIQFHNPQIECLAYSILIGKCPFFCDLTKT